MKKLKRVVLISWVFCLAGTSIFAQIDDKQLIKKDTTRQDNTRLVQEKNIKDTVKDTITRKKKSGRSYRSDTMYVVPDKDRKKSSR